MALKECKECKKEISSTATKCPLCGCSDPHNKMLTGLVICFIFFILCLGSCVMCVNSCPEPDPNAWKTENDDIAACVRMQYFVKDHLKSPSSAKFSWDNCNHVKYLGNRKYFISSHVDAQNSFGAMIRITYIGEVEQIGKDRWKLNSLDMKEP